jgi:hypothetical protein
MFEPKMYPIRRPTDTGTKNGMIENPPIFTPKGGLGGLTNASKVSAKSKTHKVK